MHEVSKYFTIIALFLCFACRNNTPPNRINFSKEAEVVIYTAEKELTFDVEIAAVPAKRIQGLMFRYSMEPNQGMFFIFDHMDLQTFWMKNTYLSLDMIFIDADYNIVQIHENAFPLKEDPITSDVPAMYVFEVLGGTTKKEGIEVGNRVELRIE